MLWLSSIEEATDLTESCLSWAFCTIFAFLLHMLARVAKCLTVIAKVEKRI